MSISGDVRGLNQTILVKAEAWSPKELRKLLGVHSQIEFIQKEIDEVVRCLIHCPQITELCPPLKEYKSAFREIDPNEALFSSEKVSELEEILRDVKVGRDIQVHLKRLDKLFQELNLKRSYTQVRTLMEWSQFVSVWLDFARDPENKALLMDPLHHQLLYGLSKIPDEVSEDAFAESLDRMQRIQDQMMASILSSSKKIEPFEKFYSPVDKIVVAASGYFEELNKIPSECVVMRALMKQPFEDVVRISSEIQASQEWERLADAIVKDNDLEKTLEASKLLVNDEVFPKLPPLAQLQVLESLAALDPTYGNCFKRLALEYSDSLNPPPDLDPSCLVS